jgi:hypothetical protein
MKVKWIATAFASAALMAALGTVSDRAEAGIVCSNGSQKVQGTWLATPYCQDELVAQVARQ